MPERSASQATAKAISTAMRRRSFKAGSRDAEGSLTVEAHSERGVWRIRKVAASCSWATRRRPNPGRSETSTSSIIIPLAEVGDQVFAHHPTQSVFEFHRLDEEVVLGIKLGRAHGRLEIKAESLLNAAHPRALGEIEKEHKVENDGRGENRVAAKEVDLDLHRIAEPAEDVDVIPALFVAADLVEKSGGRQNIHSLGLHFLVFLCAASKATR